MENFTYTPPADCPGPWAKVVLEADINLNAGIQYDRTANFWLGPVNIYFGTTAEPSNIGPSWHIENDLTDYSSIFYTAQPVRPTSETLCAAALLRRSMLRHRWSSIRFPRDRRPRFPPTWCCRFRLALGRHGRSGLNSSTLSGTFTMPTNVETAYLDVYAQSQIER